MFNCGNYQRSSIQKETRAGEKETDSPTSPPEVLIQSESVQACRKSKNLPELQGSLPDRAIESCGFWVLSLLWVHSQI
jgi:hypothetical protein